MKSERYAPENEKDRIIRYANATRSKLHESAIRWHILKTGHSRDDPAKALRGVAAILKLVADFGDYSLIELPLYKRLRADIERDGTMKGPLLTTAGKRPAKRR